MMKDSASLPPGAGTTSGGGNPAYPERWTARESSHREVALVEERIRPSAAVVAGAALAGALAGAAVPFMLSGRGPAGRRESAVVEEAVVIRRSPREIYDFWRDFANLPRFMDNIESVTRINDVRSHWVIKAPAGTRVEFNSLVTEDIPGRLIAWKSEEGASVPNRGRVEFIGTSDGTGTNVRTAIAYDPPAGALGRIVAKLFRREPGVQARQDLDRLKALLEG